MDPYWKRQEEMQEDKSLKAASGVFYFNAAICFIFAIVSIVMIVNFGAKPDEALGILIGTPLLILFGVLYVFVGKAVKQGQRWGRNVGLILAAIGLLGFPLGTLLSVYALYHISKASQAGVFA